MMTADAKENLRRPLLTSPGRVGCSGNILLLLMAARTIKSVRFTNRAPLEFPPANSQADCHWPRQVRVNRSLIERSSPAQRVIHLVSLRDRRLELVPDCQVQTLKFRR